MQRFHVPHLLIIILGSALLFYLFNYVPPIDQSSGSINIPVVVAFLLTVLVVTTSILTLIFYHIRHLFNPHIRVSAIYRVSLREGALLGAGIVFLLFLLITRTINAVTVGLTILTIALVEWYSS